METILATFGKLILLWFGIRLAIHVVNVFCRIARGGFNCIAFPALAVTVVGDEWDAWGDQIVLDIGAVVPYALTIAGTAFGLFVVWSMFKRLSMSDRSGSRGFSSLGSSGIAGSNRTSVSRSSSGSSHKIQVGGIDHSKIDHDYDPDHDPAPHKWIVTPLDHSQIDFDYDPDHDS